MQLEDIKPALLEKVFVYSVTDKKIYCDRYVVAVRITSSRITYTLNAGWEADEIYVSRSLCKLVDRLILAENQRHDLEINNLKKYLCVE